MTKQRIIKFRAWDGEKMCKSFTLRHAIFECVPRKDVGTIYMQWTGLTDRKGVEVFEGDVVIQKIWNGENGIETESIVDEFEGVVIWDTNGFGIQTKGCKTGESEVPLFKGNKFIETEVIGNIFSNPTLLQPPQHFSKKELKEIADDHIESDCEGEVS